MTARHILALLWCGVHGAGYGVWGAEYVVRGAEYSPLPTTHTLPPTPHSVGHLVASRFVSTPHPNFNGNPAPPAEITYPEACTWWGALRFARQTRDTLLLRQLEARFLPLLGPERRLQPLPDHVDHSLFGIVPLQLAAQTANPTYRAMGLWYADAQWNRALLTGKATDTMDSCWQARYWIDDIFMITTLQTQVYDLTRDPRYLDRTARLIASYLQRLQRPDGLFYHAEDVPFRWCRGNGWVAAGLTELLRALPEGHALRPFLLDAYRRMMAALLRHQHADGLWGQLIDDAEAWSETSGSAMFTYALVSGVRRGWLPADEYEPVCRRAWTALCQHLTPEGDLTDVCEGTNKTPSRDFYLTRRRFTGNLHGQAPLLWCATALLEEDYWMQPRGTFESRRRDLLDYASDVPAHHPLYEVFTQLCRAASGRELQDEGMQTTFDIVRSNHDCNGTQDSISRATRTWPAQRTDRIIERYDRELREHGRVLHTEVSPFILSEANVETYRTPDYMLSTVLDYRPGQPGYQQHVWMATLSPRALVYTTCPGSRNLRNSPSYWSGNVILPRAVQEQNLALCIYHPKDGEGPAFTHAYFPVEEFDEVFLPTSAPTADCTPSEHWIFARKGDAYLALYSARPLRLQRDMRGVMCDAVADGRRNVWLCELGSALPTPFTPFSAFIAAHLAAPITADAEAGTVRYTSPTLGPVNFGWAEPFVVNGKEKELRFPYHKAEDY